MAFKVTTPPVAEPLLITDAVVKQTLRVIDTAEDAFITMLLGKAREWAEQVTWRALMPQTITLVMDKFPSPSMETSSSNWYGPAWGTAPGPLTSVRPDNTTGFEIWLPRSPLQAVTSVQYYDTDGVQQTLAGSAYIVDTISEPGRITPAVGTSWPSTQNRPGAVTVTFTAGYASAAQVPIGIQHWMLLVVGTLYENREMIAILTRGKAEQLPYVDGLISGHRVNISNPPAYWA